MVNIPTLLAGLFGAFVVARALKTGSGTPDGQGLRRDEQPVIFWMIVILGVCVVAALFFFAFLGSPLE